uniref:Uncharacterized protein n=1 Tax=Arundo donax TaxID=35708 RepID=A0A0A9BSA6_ARUDO
MSSTMEVAAGTGSASWRRRRRGVVADGGGSRRGWPMASGSWWGGYRRWGRGRQMGRAGCWLPS